MSIAVMGRTVTEMVDDIGTKSPDTIFYIGSKSGFFFIGTKAEYDESIDVLSAKIKASYQDSIAKAKERLEANTSKSYKIKAKESLESFGDRLALAGKQIKNDLGIVDRNTEILDVWKDIPERKVKSADKKDPLLDPKGVILIVAGPEGGVWFKEELKGGKANGTEKD